MIAKTQYQNQASPFWVSFKNDPSERIIQECFEELNKALKRAELDRQILEEMQVEDSDMTASIQRLSANIVNMRQSIENYESLNQYSGDNSKVKFTQEVPSLLVQELNDCMPGIIKFKGQNKSGIQFLADHEMLIKALRLLLKFFNPKHLDVSVAAEAFDQIVTLKFRFKETLSHPRFKGLSVRLIHQILSNMKVPLIFDEHSVELAFKRV